MSENLVQKVALEEDFDAYTWATIFEASVVGLLKFRPLSSFTVRTKLSIAIVIVGTGKVEYFNTVYKILCDWEKIGGAYYIAQKEILRQFILHFYRESLQESISIGTAITADSINKIFTAIIENNIQIAAKQPHLKASIIELKSELLSLLDEIRMTTKLGAVMLLDRYSEKYPLSTYITWFLNWSRRILRRSRRNAPPEKAISDYLVSSDEPRHHRHDTVTTTLCRDIFSENVTKVVPGSSSASTTTETDDNKKSLSKATQSISIQRQPDGDDLSISHAPTTVTVKDKTDPPRVLKVLLSDSSSLSLRPNKLKSHQKRKRGGSADNNNSNKLSNTFPPVVVARQEGEQEYQLPTAVNLRDNDNNTRNQNDNSINEYDMLGAELRTLARSADDAATRYQAKHNGKEAGNWSNSHRKRRCETVSTSMTHTTDIHTRTEDFPASTKNTINYNNNYNISEYSNESSLPATAPAVPSPPPPPPNDLLGYLSPPPNPTGQYYHNTSTSHGTRKDSYLTFKLTYSEVYEPDEPKEPLSVSDADLLQDSVDVEEEEEGEEGEGDATPTPTTPSAVIPGDDALVHKIGYGVTGLVGNLTNQVWKLFSPLSQS